MSDTRGIEQKLGEATRRLGRHESRSRFGAAALSGVAIALVVLAVLLVLDRFAPLDRTPSRALLFFAGAGFVIAAALPFALLARSVWLRRRALGNLEESARWTERQAPSLTDRLVPALQVAKIREDSRTGYSTDLVDAYAHEILRDVEAVQPRSLPYFVALQHAARRCAGGVAVLAVVVAVFGPTDAARGFLNIAGAAGRLGPRPGPEFAIRPGDGSVPRGGAVRLEVDVRHAVVAAGASSAVLEWRVREDEPWRDVALRGVAEQDGARFEHEMTDVQDSFRYRFRHGGAVSREHAMEAVAAPGLAIEEVRYQYPAYTQLAERVVQDGGGDLAAVRGTTARLIVRSTNEPQSAFARLGSGGEVAFKVEAERRLSGVLAIRADDTYSLHMEDVLGLKNANPPEYRVRALADEPPFLRLLEPGEDRNLDETLKQRLRFSALDDFGLGPVEVVWEVSRRPGRAARARAFTPQGVQTEIDASWEWDLSGMDLLPGDAVVYHLEVRDNNAVEGPSAARTRDYVLRFPTLGEVFAEIDEEQEASIDDLAEAVDEARRIETKMEDVAREILKQGESSWENKQEVERALQAQEQLAERLREAREGVKSNLQNLAESEFATLDALEKLEKIQSLLEEVASREMKETLEKLREAMREQNPDEAQRDLAEFQESQEELMKQLDRILENLEQFRLDERLKAAVRRMEELAANQERLNDELANRDDAPKNEKEAGADDQQDGAKDAKDDSAKEKDDEASKSDDAGKKDAAGKKDDAGKQDAAGKKDGAPPDAKTPKDLKRMAEEEKAFAEEMRKLEKEVEDLAKKTEEIRESRDAQTMKDLASQMNEADVPKSMDGMSEQLQQGEPQKAEADGEKALTELRELLTMLNQAQQGMSMQMAQISQAAVNRAVRDLLSLSDDQEALSVDLDDIPRNSSSATRAFADEQQLLLRGAQRVRDMLEEVAKDTPLMDSKVGRGLDEGISSMKDAAEGLESGAVHLANDEGDSAVQELNSVVIELLKAAQSMSSCASGMPMSSFMQQLKELSQDQQKLNDALKKLREQGGQSLDQRLQSQMKSLAERQRQIQQELQQLMKEMGSGEGVLGRLDDVSQKLDEIAKKLEGGKLDDATLREQEWALTRLLDSQRSMRERDLGRERISESGEDLANGLPPSALPEGTEGAERDLREDLLKALDRRYPPKYEDLIRRYFRELSREAPAPDLP